MISQKPKNNQEGYAALMSILIIGAVGVLVATTMLMVSVSSVQVSMSIKNSDQARYMSDTCAEAALMEIRNSTDFSGIKSQTFPEGECSYDIIKGSGETRTIQVTGKSEENIRKTKIQIDKINPKINVTSWQEVADF